MDYETLYNELLYEKLTNNDINQNVIIEHANAKILNIIKNKMGVDNVNFIEICNEIKKTMNKQEQTKFFISYIIAYMKIISLVQDFNIDWQIVLDEEPSVVINNDNKIESLITGTEYDSVEVLEMLINYLENIKSKTI